MEDKGEQRRGSLLCDPAAPAANSNVFEAAQAGYCRSVIGPGAEGSLVLAPEAGLPLEALLFVPHIVAVLPLAWSGSIGAEGWMPN